MKQDYRKIKMEIVREIVAKKGYYFIKTTRLYDSFVGAEYIIVTDDEEITARHPQLLRQIIVSTAKFKEMAEAYNAYLRNEIREIRRQKKYHNDDGYFENGVADESEDRNRNLPIFDLPDNPTEKQMLTQLETERIREVMSMQTKVQQERINLYYFEGLTYRDIARKQGVSDMSVRESISSATKKMKNFL